MQDVHNYIPETNHVSEVYTVAAVLHFQSVPHVMLFRPSIIIIIIITEFSSEKRLVDYSAINVWQLGLTVSSLFHIRLCILLNFFLFSSISKNQL
jgi:hypothetical protein